MTTTPVGGPGGTHPPEKPPQNTPPATPSQDDAARFSKALDKPKDSSADSNRTSGGEYRPTNDHSSLFRRRETPEQQQHGRGDSRGRETEKKDRPPEEPSPANAILQNMMAKPVEQVKEAQPVDAPQPVQQLNEVVQQVADRILVGESSETGQAEVRITLKDSVLDGTEIRVTENAGAYEITFVADNKDIETFLANRQEQITTSLGEKLDKEIKVAVTDRDGTPNQQGDERGRQQGQPGDGRSRNQRSAEDEREE